MYKKEKQIQYVYHTNLNVHLITEKFDYFIWTSKKKNLKLSERDFILKLIYNAIIALLRCCPETALVWWDRLPLLHQSKKKILLNCVAQSFLTSSAEKKKTQFKYH